MRSRFFLRVIFFILIPFTVGLFTYIFLHRFLLEPVNTSGRKSVFVEINRENSFQDVCKTVADKNLIRHWRVLDIIARLRGKSLKLKVGEYLLYPYMSPIEIFETLRTGNDYKRSFEIYPGMNSLEMAQVIASAGIMPADAFISQTKSRQLLLQAGLRTSSFEGYLASGRYGFSKLGKPSQLIWKMYTRSESDWSTNLSNLAAARNLSRHDVLTIASLIQKEVQLHSQYNDFAAYVLNRVKAFEKLEVESTLRYALNNFMGKITPKLKATEHPYNTYVNFGLPPGPICTPSFEAISAAANPSLIDFTNYKKLPNGILQFY